MTLKGKEEQKNLEYIAQKYFETKDLTLAAEELWPLLVTIPRFYVKDPEIRSNFFVHLYENLPALFESYKKHKQAAFKPYLLQYSKNLFFNFIRNYRRKEIKEVIHHDLPDELNRANNKYNDDKNFSGNHIGELELKAKSINKLSLAHRVLVKLYFGLELDLKELEEFVIQVGSPIQVEYFLKERRGRKKTEVDNQKKYENRKAHLHYLMHRAKSKPQVRALAQRKNRAIEIYNEKRSISEVTNLAKLFSVSKSTIYRRLEDAAGKLYRLQKT